MNEPAANSSQGTAMCRAHQDRPAAVMFGYYTSHCRECLDRILDDPRSRWTPDPPDFPWSA